MAVRNSGGSKASRIVVVLATMTYLAGLALAPPAQTFGGSCNGYLSEVRYDGSHEKGPLIIDGTDGDDVIRGHGGNDRICGGGGADTIYGDGTDAPHYDFEAHGAKHIVLTEPAGTPP